VYEERKIGHPELGFGGNSCSAWHFAGGTYK
jgi:hypothetical protein